MPSWRRPEGRGASRIWENGDGQCEVDNVRYIGVAAVDSLASCCSRVDKATPNAAGLLLATLIQQVPVMLFQSFPVCAFAIARLHYSDKPLAGNLYTGDCLRPPPHEHFATNVVDLCPAKQHTSSSNCTIAVAFTGPLLVLWKGFRQHQIMTQDKRGTIWIST